MTPEELLRPRYKVIADYPDSPFTVGQIIELTNKADKEFSYTEEYFILIPGQRCNTAYGETYFNCFPHLFKKLEWWEERKPEDMPPYVKGISNGAVIKVEKVHFSTNTYLPATEAEYLQYIESLKQTT